MARGRAVHHRLVSGFATAPSTPAATTRDQLVWAHPLPTRRGKHITQEALLPRASEAPRRAGSARLRRPLRRPERRRAERESGKAERLAAFTQVTDAQRLGAPAVESTIMASAPPGTMCQLSRLKLRNLRSPPATHQGRRKRQSHCQQRQPNTVRDPSEPGVRGGARRAGPVPEQEGQPQACDAMQREDNPLLRRLPMRLTRQ